MKQKIDLADEGSEVAPSLARAATGNPQTLAELAAATARAEKASPVRQGVGGVRGVAEGTGVYYGCWHSRGVTATTTWIGHFDPPTPTTRRGRRAVKANEKNLRE